jgi:hypothetical protein
VRIAANSDSRSRTPSTVSYCPAKLTSVRSSAVADDRTARGSDFSITLAGIAQSARIVMISSEAVRAAPASVRSGPVS